MSGSGHEQVLLDLLRGREPAVLEFPADFSSGSQERVRGVLSTGRFPVGDLDTLPATERSVVVFATILAARKRSNIALIWQVRHFARTGPRWLRVFWRSARAAWLVRQRRPHAVLRLTDGESLVSTPIERAIAATVLGVRGRAYEFLGDFRFAGECYRRALGHASALGLSTESAHRQRLANLLWASGQFRRAADLHGNEADREAARQRGDWKFLARSLLSVSKCALDLGHLARANRELALAFEVIQEHSGEDLVIEGYQALYSAELDLLCGNEKESIELFEYAIELFHLVDPPYYSGIVDAQLGIAKQFLDSKHYDAVLRIVGRLLLDAERRGHVDIRARLLAFQAQILVMDDAPREILERAYEDLVTRVQLANNPTLTFKAYADLFIYARRRLDRREQKFWLARLRGLRSLLERSSYEDLFRTYVTERFWSDLEQELEDVDRELEGWDIPEE